MARELAGHKQALLEKLTQLESRVLDAKSQAAAACPPLTEAQKVMQWSHEFRFFSWKVVGVMQRDVPPTLAQSWQTFSWGLCIVWGLVVLGFIQPCTITVRLIMMINE